MITRTTCRVCDGPFEQVLSLGEQYVSNFLAPEQPDGIKAPLDLVLCKQCSLLQLRHAVPCNAMYQNYWYRSGTNQTMRDALADIAHTAEQLINLQEGDTVLDIGCNDGTLLASYQTKDILKIGFDPAENLSIFSSQIADFIYEDFFTAETFERNFKVQPKIVTSIAMFYDLEDPNKFVSDVKKVMHSDGVWVIQMSYLPSMLKQHDFGNICHEHLEYYSLKSLEYLLNKHDFVIYDVQFNDINGGSFRIFVRNKDAKELTLRKPYNQQAANRVKAVRANEAKMNLGDAQSYSEFATWTKRIKNDVMRFIDSEVWKDRKIVVYGASTKGNTMLQYFGLNRSLIFAAADRNPDKWGLETVGTRIPIISEEQARNLNPDYFLVLPWHFIEEFKTREKDYLLNGGRFIVPLPHFTLI